MTIKTAKVDRARERREQNIRRDAFQNGYIKGINDGREQMQAEIRALIGAEKEGEASRLTDRCG